MKSPWTTKKLGEICEENKKSPLKVEDADNAGNFPFFTSGDSILRHSQYLVDGENIFLSTGGYAHVKYYKGKASYSADTWSLKVKNALTKYVYYQILEKIKWIDAILFRGTGLRHLQKKEFLNLKIPLPPLPIQQKIVSILDTIQEAIDLQNKIIETTKELKKSLMADLFKYGSPSFRKGRKLKKTEIGEIPENWEVVRLGDNYKGAKLILILRNGLVYKQTELKEKGIPITRIETIAFEKIDFNKVGYLENLPSKIIAEYKLLPGDILFSHINSEEHLGKTAIFNDKNRFLLHGMNLLLIRPNQNIIFPEFLNHLFKLYKNRGIFVQIASRAVNQSSINQRVMNLLKLPLPPLSEQHEIADILQTIDKKIEIEKKKKELYEELFKTMLNKLMNGEIDVEKIEI